MALDFPTSPTLNQTYSLGSKTWTWNGEGWELVPNVVVGTQGIQGIQGTSGAQGSQGTLGAQGAQGTSGSQGAQGTSGSQGAQGSSGAQGTQGTLGAQGSSGAQGTQGTQGLQGTTGTTGNIGGVPYTFSTIITDTDPTNGKIQYNSGTIGAVSFIYIDNNDANSDVQTTWYDTWDDSTNPNQEGYLIIQGAAAGSTVVNVWSITGAVTVASGYYKIPVAHISGSLPADGAALAVSFSRTGNQGSQGTSGAQGVQGISGSQGTQGTQGTAGLAPNYSRKTTTYTAVARDQIIADTSGGAFTITLPATPSTGDLVRIADGADWSVSNLTVARNGSTIEGTAEDLTVDIGKITLDFVYDSTTWEVFPSSGLSILSPVNTTASGTYYPVFVDGAGGSRSAGIRTTDTAFSFDPSTCTLTAVDFNSTSDINLKTNIHKIDNALNKILQLDGITFNWKKDNRPSVGIIAQDVEKLFPELVNEVNGEKTVNYNGLIGLLIEGIKELNTKIGGNS